jgi:hypothetical protein
MAGDLDVRADTAIVVGAVVIAGGILFLIYNAEQKTASGVERVYNDVTSLPGRAADALGRGYDRLAHWLSGSDRVSDNMTPSSLPDPNEHGEAADDLVNASNVDGGDLP